MTVTNSVDIYDIADNSLTVENLSQPLVMHSTAGVEDHMIVAGGITYLDPEWYRISRVEIYNYPACYVGVPEAAGRALFSSVITIYVCKLKVKLANSIII